MRMQIDTLEATAQAEFLDFRGRTGRGWAYFSSPRLVVLPDRLMARFGGAASIWRWTCVCPKLLQAPAEVRQAILAHEWGHARSGHCLATTSAFAVALLYAYISETQPSTGPWLALNIALLLLVGSAVLWTIMPGREFEADDVAAKLLGPVQVVHGIRWIVDHLRDGVQSDAIIARLDRLDRGASEGR